MSYTVTKYPSGTFSWADISSTDISQTKVFLNALFGWTSQDMPSGEGMPDYTMFYMGRHTVAGGSPSYTKGMPTLWNSYITVDNVDVMVKKAEELGGKIIIPASDVMDAGRMAGIQDPTGATFLIWQAKKHIGAELINTIGAMCWNELYTKNLEKAKVFYSQLFGWVIEADETGYYMIKNNGRMNGGMMLISPEMGEMPPCWMVYFTVKDINEATKTVKKHGGKVFFGPTEAGPGKIATVTDPTNGAFMLIEMNMSPEEWVE